MCGTNRKQPVDERHTESTDGFMENHKPGDKESPSKLGPPLPQGIHP